jgi:hypothetical protein|tara:strand:+ start:182 stop:796 length:615 start_codon:yes stop_codon:yes gene_type:complete
MAYKKYIERDGKMYGPYIYHSKRVDGKVVSQYKGTRKGFEFNLGSKNLKVLLVVLAIFLLIGVFYVIYNGEFEITGDVVSNIEPEKINLINELDYKLNPNLDLNNFPTGLKLTNKERDILEREIGDLSIEIERAVVKNGFLTVRYGLGDYWVEFNYEENIGKDALNKAMVEDRIKWLKDLSKRFASESEQSVGVESLSGQKFKI